MKYALFLFFSSLSILCLYSQTGGPWTPRTGGGFLNGQFSYWGYDEVQLIDDTSRSGLILRSVTDMTVMLNAVYGGTDRLTIFASVPIKIVSTGETINSGSDFTDTLPNGRITGLGNVIVGVKYKFFHKNNWVMAASLSGELKTGQFDSKTGLRTAYDSWGVIPVFQIGRSWKEKYYISADIGGCYRSDNYSGDWRISVETGANFFKFLWLRLGIDSRRSFRNGGFENPNNLQTSLMVNNQEWLALNFKAEYMHPVGIGVQAGISGYFLGNNIPNAPYITGGVFYKWNYDLNDAPRFRIEDKPKE